MTIQFKGPVAAAVLAAAVNLSAVAPAWAQSTASAATVPSTITADAFIKTVSADVLNAVRQDKTILVGDVRKVVSLVDTKVLPHVNFERMTAAAVGRNWRQATPDQRVRLQNEFKTLLIYTYAGAIAQVRDQTVEVKPLRAAPDATDVVVRTLVRGQGDPIQLDYRVEKTPTGWKIYDVNVLGAWLVQTYQSSFAQEVSATGIDGLIGKLSERNKQLANRKPAG